MLVAIAVSMMAHVPALTFLVESFDESHALPSPDISPAKDDFAISLTEDRAAEDEDREEDEDERDGQFVSFEPPEQEEEPDEARLYDQYESRADRETVRRETSSPREETGDAESPEREPDERPESPQQPEESQEPDESRSDDGESETRAPDEPDPEGDEKLEEEPNEEGLVEEGQASDEEAREDRKVDPRELFPKNSDASRMFGAEQADYVEGIDEGDETLLNRKESKFWTFMDRLKRRVAREWSPVEEFRRHDPNGRRYGVKDRFVKLRITLESDGSLRSIYVEEPSGAEFFDDEAVRSVRASAPFPNPPEGMQDRDGLIRLSFGFLLDVERGGVPDLRLRRR